jgi:hypothetical protein
MKPKSSPADRRDVVTLADLAPRHPVTGGSARRIFGADPLSHPAQRGLAASKKPTSDLAAGKDIKAGKKKS